MPVVILTKCNKNFNPGRINYCYIKVTWLALMKFLFVFKILDKLYWHPKLVKITNFITLIKQSSHVASVSYVEKIRSFGTSGLVVYVLLLGQVILDKMPDLITSSVKWQLDSCHCPLRLKYVILKNSNQNHYIKLQWAH